jgi:hypothetical protein
VLRVKFWHGVVELLLVEYREITLPPYSNDYGYVASQTWRQEGGDEVVEELLMSFTISLEVTFIILIKLGLETPESLHGRIQDGNLPSVHGSGLGF